jgi:hypothetical protein
MKGSCFSEAQIIGMLREHEAWRRDYKTSCDHARVLVR